MSFHSLRESGSRNPTGGSGNQFDMYAQFREGIRDVPGIGNYGGAGLGFTMEHFRRQQDRANQRYGMGRYGPGGGGGRGRGPTVNLDPYKNRELDAMKELLMQQTSATRTQLSGERASAATGFEQFQAMRQKQLGDELRANRGTASSRGILDSGIFLEDRAELENVSATEISNQDVQVTAFIDALSRQIGGTFDFLGRGANDYGIGSLESTRAAQEAAQRAQIERSYLNARIAQGG